MDRALVQCRFRNRCWMPDVADDSERPANKKDMSALCGAEDLRRDVRDSVDAACDARKDDFDEAVENCDIESCYGFVIITTKMDI